MLSWPVPVTESGRSLLNCDNSTATNARSKTGWLDVNLPLSRLRRDGQPDNCWQAIMASDYGWRYMMILFPVLRTFEVRSACSENLRQNIRSNNKRAPELKGAFHERPNRRLAESFILLIGIRLMALVPQSEGRKPISIDRPQPVGHW